MAALNCGWLTPLIFATQAQWKGTDVAVKLIAAEQGVLSKEMQRAFKDEVEVMTALRHPHVVLFMAACTRPPRMCIVMEFMALGSLYDVRHNQTHQFHIEMRQLIKASLHACSWSTTS